MDARDAGAPQDLRQHTGKKLSGAKSGRCAARHSTRSPSAAPPVHDGAVVDMSRDDFEEAVSEALDLIPLELAEKMDNVVVLVEDEPTAEQLAGEEDLLGIYEGTPLTERDSWWAAGSLPDRITIFRGPTLRMCETEEEVVEEVAVTVVHEIAHHFGIEEERLHELGWR